MWISCKPPDGCTQIEAGLWNGGAGHGRTAQVWRDRICGHFKIRLKVFLKECANCTGYIEYCFLELLSVLWHLAWRPTLVQPVLIHEIQFLNFSTVYKSNIPLNMSSRLKYLAMTLNRPFIACVVKSNNFLWSLMEGLLIPSLVHLLHFLTTFMAFG